MATCELCNCPLTLLNGFTGKPEKRKQCVRCDESQLAAWKAPPKPKRLAIDDFIEQSGKGRRKKEMH